MRLSHLAGLLTTALLLSFVADAVAQPPLPELLTGKSGTLKRLPDDQIEGTIWEYKGKPKTKPKEGEKVPELEGMFRTEGKALFDVSRQIKLPSKDKVKKVVESIRSGKPQAIKLPTAPKPKRIGDYRKLKSGKLRLDFNDKESINGLMLIWKKKKTDDVWMGTFTEKKGRKIVRSWIVEVRPIED